MIKGPFLHAFLHLGLPKWPKIWCSDDKIEAGPLLTDCNSSHLRNRSASLGCHNVEEENDKLSCVICEVRKEKRFCPAVHGRICAQCCGEQREVTLDCPSDCPYLQQSREHEKPRSAEQFDAGSLFLQVEISEQFTYEREHLLMGLSYALAKAARADRSLNDRDLISALSAMSSSYERLVNSGLHYEQPLASAAQHAVAAQVEEMVKQYREAEQKQMGYSNLRDSDVLKALVFLLRLGQGRTSGRPRSRAFIDFLFARFPEKESAVLTPQEAGSRIIVP
jgi:hypothetical protein